MRFKEFMIEAFSQAAADRNKLKYQKQGRIGHGIGWKPISDSPHEIVNNIVHQFDNITRMVAYDRASNRVKHSMVERFMKKYGYPLELFPDVIAGIEAKSELDEGLFDKAPKVDWNKRAKELFAKGMDEQQVRAQLLKEGCPPRQVDVYVQAGQLEESATAGATSAANIGTVVNPHISPGKARGKKSYTGSPGKSGT